MVMTQLSVTGRVRNLQGSVYDNESAVVRGDGPAAVGTAAPDTWLGLPRVS